MEVVVTAGAVRCTNLQSDCHLQQAITQVLQAAFPSCPPTNNVKAPKGVVKNGYKNACVRRMTQRTVYAVSILAQQCQSVNE